MLPAGKLNSRYYINYLTPEPDRIIDLREANLNDPAMAAKIIKCGASNNYAPGGGRN